MAQRGAATGPLRDVALAALINQRLGGAVVAPWELAHLPPEWIEPVIALATRGGARRAAAARIENAKALIRRDFRKQFGRHLH